MAIELNAKYDHNGAKVCKCTHPEFYVLFTHTFNSGTPVECGTCNHQIPLYKLNTLTSDSRAQIHIWETNYKACDDLQLGCTVGEQWATKQMMDLNSPLSKEGINLCTSLTLLTGIKTYYYLFNYRNISIEKDKKRPCPSCNGNWFLENSTSDFYDFKCDNCHLISSLTCK